MRRSCLVAIVWCVGLTVSIWPVVASEVAFKFGPDLSANDWHYFSFPNRPGAQFSASSDDAVIVRAEAGVAILWH